MMKSEREEGVVHYRCNDQMKTFLSNVNGPGGRSVIYVCTPCAPRFIVLIKFTPARPYVFCILLGFILN